MTDPVSSAAAKAAVSGALRQASEKTGVGFDYLYRVAVRESSLNPKAKAATSSAAGLFQFIEQTWLEAVRKFGPAHGLGAYAADIAVGENGRLAVSDPARRKEILDLRFDPEKAAALAGELARENQGALERTLGRAVDAAELYAAHFLGAGGAKTLLSADAAADAAALLPAAAKANRHVFYDGARARSVGEVIESFRRTIGGAADRATEIGERVEMALAPIFETAARVSAPFTQRAHPYEMKALSPLVLAVLQALDPRDIGRRERE